MSSSSQATLQSFRKFGHNMISHCIYIEKKMGLLSFLRTYTNEKLCFLRICTAAAVRKSYINSHDEQIVHSLSECE